MAIDEKLIGIISETLTVEEEQVVPDAAYKADLGADSLRLIELTLALEESYEIEIPDGVAEKIKTVQDTQDYLNKVITL